jgi:hypothetical protein
LKASYYRLLVKPSSLWLRGSIIAFSRG